MNCDEEALAAIESVYRLRGADYFRFACARTLDVEAAHDAVQEGFANAIRHRHGLRSAGSLEAWIARCVINAARDMAEGVGTVEWIDTPSNARDSDLEGAALRAAIRQLPPRQRDALFLRFYLDFDYATIARVLSVEIGTVSATLSAARQNLATAFEEVRT